MSYHNDTRAIFDYRVYHLMHSKYATTANTANNMQNALALLCNFNLCCNSDRIPLATYTEI